MRPVDLATIELALSQLALGDPAVEHDIVSATEALGELLQRAWAVRVLDRQARRIGRSIAPTQGSDGTFFITWGSHLHTGADEDAARLAAAKGAWSELPADERAELGECP